MLQQKKIEMAVYIKSTILKLENSRNMLEIVFLCTLNMLNFKRLALIATEMKRNETKYFGSIALPHKVHSCAIITSRLFLKNGGRYCFGFRHRIRHPRRLRGCFALYLGCY